MLPASTAMIISTVRRYLFPLPRFPALPVGRTSRISEVAAYFSIRTAGHDSIFFGRWAAQVCRIRGELTPAFTVKKIGSPQDMGTLMRTDSETTSFPESEHTK